MTTATHSDDRPAHSGDQPAEAQWHAGDMVWIASLDGNVVAAIVAAATPDRVRLAMGSTNFAYECGYSPSDPSLFHSRDEAERFLRQQRSR